VANVHLGDACVAVCVSDVCLCDRIIYPMCVLSLLLLAPQACAVAVAVCRLLVVGCVLLLLWHRGTNKGYTNTIQIYV